MYRHSKTAKYYKYQAITLSEISRKLLSVMSALDLKQHHSVMIILFGKIYELARALSVERLGENSTKAIRKGLFFIKWNGNPESVSHRVSSFCSREAKLCMGTGKLRALVETKFEDLYENGQYAVSDMK